MRATLPNVLPLAAAALLAATPAAAQRAVSARAVAPEVAAASIVRPVATYQLRSTRSARLPERITVADSAGALVAHYRLPGDRKEYPMLVVVMGPDLVLQGETPAGILTLELLDANTSGETPTRAAQGRWHVDAQHGTLQGRAAR